MSLTRKATLFYNISNKEFKIFIYYFIFITCFTYCQNQYRSKIPDVYLIVITKH